MDHMLLGDTYLDGLLDVINEVRATITHCLEQSPDVGGRLHRAWDEERRIDAELAGALPQRDHGLLYPAQARAFQPPPLGPHRVGRPRRVASGIRCKRDG